MNNWTPYVVSLARIRLICIGGAAVVATALELLYGHVREIPFAYAIFDAIMSTVALPILFRMGAGATVAHVLISATWFIAAWDLAGMIR
jgi:hypothetical protein